jgi:hypothetical protein
MYLIKHLRPIFIVRGPDDRPDMVRPDARPLAKRTSLSIAPIMNLELKEVQVAIRAADTGLDPEIYSNKPDHAWLGTTSPNFNDEVNS